MIKLPEKITKINFSGAMHMGNHLDKVTKHLILEDYSIKDQVEI